MQQMKHWFPINLYYYKFNVLVRKIEIQKDLNLFF